MSFGTVRPTAFEFEWIIPNYQEFLPTPGGLTITSPDFDLSDSTWCLVFDFPYLFEESSMVYLRRRDWGPPKSIVYTIRTGSGTEVMEGSRTHIFVGKNSSSERLKLTKKQLPSTSNLLIRCHMNFIVPYRNAEGEFVASAVQQKNLPNCMSRAIQRELENSEKEVPIDEKLSSIEKKEGEFVASAVQQKNLPNCMSRAIQTELENSEKEVPIDEKLSSIEKKDVALLTERMKELLIKSSDHDLTICVQDKKFRAHRNILSVRSPVFAMMLHHDTKENNTSTINIEDCDPESFDEFLLYVYSGRTENLTPSNAVHLYNSADKYDFPVLKERCVSLLKTSLSVESICDVVLLAARHQEEELLNVATEFFARNMKKILVTVAWQKFMPQNPVEANELILKSVDINNPEK